MRSSCWSRRTGARRVQVFTHGIIPSILSSFLGIALYGLDQKIRLSARARVCRHRRTRFRAAVGDEPVLVQPISLLLIVTSVIVIAAERLSACSAPASTE
jgi:hypothetical protein